MSEEIDQSGTMRATDVMAADASRDVGNAGALQQSSKILRQGGCPFARSTGIRMDQAETLRMQGLARKYRCQMLLAIQRIADQRKTDRLHVHANLVGTPGFQLASHQADGTTIECAGCKPFETGCRRL